MSIDVQAALKCDASSPAPPHTPKDFFSKVFYIWDIWDLTSLHPSNVILYSFHIASKVFSHPFVPGGFPVQHQAYLPQESIFKPSSLGWEACFPHQFFFMCLPPKPCSVTFYFLCMWKEGGGGRLCVCRSMDVRAQANMHVRIKRSGTEFLLRPSPSCAAVLFWKRVFHLPGAHPMSPGCLASEPQGPVYLCHRSQPFL